MRGADHGAEFRDACRGIASSVMLVTYVTPGHPGHASGMTATSVVPFSDQPPSVILSLHRASRSFRVVGISGARCAINLVSSGQVELARALARPGEDKTIPEDLVSWSDGTPYLAGSVMSMTCQVGVVYEHHTHGLLVADVIGVMTTDPDQPPVVYHAGQFKDMR